MARPTSGDVHTPTTTGGMSVAYPAGGVKPKMPYPPKRVEDIPDQFDVLPADAKAIAFRVLQRLGAKGVAEGSAIPQAWGAVKNAGYHKSSEGEWVHGMTEPEMDTLIAEALGEGVWKASPETWDALAVLVGQESMEVTFELDERAGRFSTKPWSQVPDDDRTGFLYNPDPEHMSKAKLPIKEKSTGKINIHAVRAVRAVLAGARGGADLPAEDRARIKRVVDRLWAEWERMREREQEHTAFEPELFAPLAVIRLSEDGVWTQILPEGKYYHPRYREMNFDGAFLQSVLTNFKNRPVVPGQKPELVVDYNHLSLEGGPNEAIAAGWLRELAHRPGSGLWAKIDWNDKAKAFIKAGEYRYISPTFNNEDEDIKTGKPQGPTLKAVALTNRPFLTVMAPVQVALSEELYNAAWSHGSDGLTQRVETLTAKVSELEAERVAIQRRMNKVAEQEKHESGTEARTDEAKTGGGAPEAGKTDVELGKLLRESTEITRGLTTENKELKERLGKLEARDRERDLDARVKADIEAEKLPPAMKELGRKVLALNEELYNEMLGKVSQPELFRVMGEDTSQKEAEEGASTGSPEEQLFAMAEKMAKEKSIEFDDALTLAQRTPEGRKLVSEYTLTDTVYDN